MSGETDQNDHGDHEVEVHFKHVNEVEKAKFEMPKSATLAAAWDEAYIKLGIERTDKDTLQTAGDHPKPLANYLSLTLKALKEDKIVEDYRFEIVGPTGGA